MVSRPANPKPRSTAARRSAAAHSGPGGISAPVRAVTFDVGGTLIEVWPSVGHIYAEVAAEQGRGGLSPAELNRRFARAWQEKQGFDYSSAAWRRLVNDTFAGLIRPPLTKRQFAALYERFSQPEVWRVYDDVRPTLTRLKEQGLKIGVISNWDDRLRPLLSDLGLSPFCDVILVSCEIGQAKPAPEVFQRAAALLQTPAPGILHVGDSRREDFGGARAAGLPALLLDRGAKAARPLVITSLAEIPTKLGRTSN